MNMKMPPASGDDVVGRWSAKYIDIQSDIPHSKFALLERWYQWTAPPLPPATAGLEQREIARRGRLTSTILLIVLGIVFGLALPVAIAQQLFVLMGILTVILLVLVSALLLNRRGRISIAAGMLVTMMDLGLCISILTSPGPEGLNANTVPLYDIMIQSELVAVSLLPARSVFVVAFFNCTFIWASLTFWKHAPSLDALFALAGPEIYARPIMLHIIVAVVTYLWVRSASQAIARADRAQVIAALEHEVAKQEHAIAQQKHQLDYSINQITETLVRVASGNMDARVPLTQDNILWQVAGSLNNLLARLQRLRQIENEMFRMQNRLRQTMQLEQEVLRLRNERLHLIEEIRQAKTLGRPLRFTRTGTLIDPVLVELHGNIIFSPPQQKDDQITARSRYLDPGR